MEMNALKLSVLIWANLRNVIWGGGGEKHNYMYTKIVAIRFSDTQKCCFLSYMYAIAV